MGLAGELAAPRAPRQARLPVQLDVPAVAPPLTEVSEEERTRLEYRISDHSAGCHLVEFYRERRPVLGKPNFVHLHACQTEVWAQRRVTYLSGHPRKDVLQVPGAAPSADPASREALRPHRRRGAPYPIDAGLGGVEVNRAGLDQRRGVLIV